MWGRLFDLNNPLVSANNVWMLLSISICCVALSIYLEQKYMWASKVSGAVIALVLSVTLSNIGVIPMDAPVWDNVWGYIVPISIPLLLLRCDVKRIGTESGKMLGIFIISSFGTCIGALVAYLLLKVYINDLNKVATIFTGSYIGGTVNFVALSSTFNVPGELVSSSIVADNLIMIIYFFVLMAMPGIAIFRKLFKHPYIDEVERNFGNIKETNAAQFWKRKEIALKDIAILMAITLAIVSLSTLASEYIRNTFVFEQPILKIIFLLIGNQYLWITTVSMFVATIFNKSIDKLNGADEIGTFFIYIFFFVIGVPASISGIITHSPLLLVFAAVIILINMLISLIGGKLFGYSLEEIILASNANVGGPTTAVAMAISKGWNKLVGPIMLVGILGYVIGTYAGLIVGGILGAN